MCLYTISNHHASEDDEDFEQLDLYWHLFTHVRFDYDDASEKFYYMVFITVELLGKVISFTIFTRLFENEQGFYKFIIGCCILAFLQNILFPKQLKKEEKDNIFTYILLNFLQGLAVLFLNVLRLACFMKPIGDEYQCILSHSSRIKELRKFSAVLPFCELVLVFSLQFISWYFKSGVIAEFDFILHIYYWVGLGCSFVYIVMNLYYFVRNYGIKSFEEDD